MKNNKHFALPYIVLIKTYFSIMFFGGVGSARTGVDAAISGLSKFIDPIGNMIIIIGAMVGLVGGIRVFIMWNNGDQDTYKAIMSWFGSCIFLVSSGVIIRAFFGL